MAYEYEEVVNLIVKTDQMNSDLKRAKTIFDAAIADLSHVGIKANVNLTEFEIDLKKMEQARIRSEEKSRKDSQAADERVRAYKQKAEEKAVRDRAKFEEAEAVRIRKDIAQQEAAFARARIQQDKAIAREEYEIAKELFRYRKEGEQILHRQKLSDIKQQADLQRQAAQFNNIFSPAALTPKAPASIPGRTINASAALRAGAGAAGALGAYPAAGALYASANAMQVLGLSTVSTAAAFTTLGAALPVVAGGLVLFAGKEFNEELAKMSTLLASATTSSSAFAAMLDATANSAIKLSAEFNIGTTEVIRAFKEALSSGIEGGDLERFTRTAAQLSTGLGVNLKDAANILTGFKDSYQLSIGELTKANDILFNTVNYGKVNVDQLVTNFGRLLPIGKAAGVSIEDLATGVAVLTRRGLTASQAVTAMTQVVNGLTSPSKEAKKALEAMGISVEDAAFQGKSLLDVVTEIRSATGGSGSLLGTLFPEERAKRGISSLVDAIDLIKQVRTGVQETGTAAIASDRAMNTLWTNIGKKISEVTGPIKKFGSDLADKLNESMFGTSDERAKEKASYDARIADYRKFFEEYIALGVTNKAELEKLGLTGRVAEHKTKYNYATYGMMPSSYEVVTNAGELGNALDEALAGIRDRAVEAETAVNNVLKKLELDSRTFIDTLAKISNPATKPSAIEEKQFSSRATDEQKQKLDDLKSELEIKQELLETEVKQRQIDVEKQIAERSNTYLTPAKDRLEQAKVSGDTGSIINAQAELARAQQNVSEFVATLKQNLEKADPFGPIVNQITRLNQQIETLQTNVAGQDTRKNREDKERSEKESERKRIEAYTQYTSIVERLYKEDLSNYEKAQKAREAIFKRINKEIENEAKKSGKLQADIQNNIMNSKAAQNADDPGAQVRIGRRGRDAALNELKNLSGSGEDRNAFDAAVKKYQEASELIRNAMRNIDDRRAERNYQQDQEALGKLDQDFNNKFQDRKRMEGMAQSERDSSMHVRSPQELARDAAKEQKIDTKVEQVVLDAKIKMEVDGTLSEATINKIAGIVVQKVQQAQSNRNLPSNYDKRTRDNSKITSIDE